MDRTTKKGGVTFLPEGRAGDCEKRSGMREESYFNRGRLRT